MFVKKYGSTQFERKKLLRFAILVQDKKGLNFLTKDYTTEKGKEAMYFNNRDNAQDIVYDMLLDNKRAFVVEVFEDLRLINRGDKNANKRI